MRTFNLSFGVAISLHDAEVVDFKKREFPKRETVSGRTCQYPGDAELILRDKVTGDRIPMFITKIIGPNTFTGLQEAKEIVNEQIESMLKRYEEFMKEE